MTPPNTSARSAWLSVLAASFRRDLRIAVSYRLSFVLRFASTLFQVVVFYFISRLMTAAANPTLAQYGNNYFAYVLVGLAFQHLFSLSLSGYAGAITEAQQTGTMEAQAVLPVSLPWLVAGANLWPFVYALGETVVYFGLGIVLGARLAGANILAAVLLTLLASLAISGLGFMGAALILIFKRGNAVAWLVEAATALLAGVFFPPALLPAPLQKLSLLLPQTHALNGLRAALLQGADLSSVWPSLAILAGFSLALTPLGIVSLNWAYRQAKVRGNLAQY